MLVPRVPESRRLEPERETREDSTRARDRQSPPSRESGGGAREGPMTAASSSASAADGDFGLRDLPVVSRSPSGSTTGPIPPRAVASGCGSGPPPVRSSPPPPPPAQTPPPSPPTLVPRAAPA